MTTSIPHTLLIWCFACCAAIADDSPAQLFEQAERLSRSKRPTEAMEKVEQAVALLDRAHTAGENIEWAGMNGLRFAARLARVDFLDYEKSLAFCDKLYELADGDYWRVPARLERALTYRAMSDFAKAQAEYDAIGSMDERQRSSAILPQAEMVYFDMANKAEGEPLIVTALHDNSINGRERFNTLRKCAAQALDNGHRDEALRWYAMLESLPFQKSQDRAKFLSQAWLEMGRIEESLGRTAEAKNHYRRVMELEEGEMRFRAQARDALESIEYFE
jgi:tetratricopeptide (TPR) repeat protein